MRDEPERVYAEPTTPSYALRVIPTPTKMPKDDLGRDIAFLLASHPEVAERFDHLDLDKIMTESKVALLAEIHGLLGIKPTRRRRLGYVGS